jgi:hypothetical protein
MIQNHGNGFGADSDREFLTPPFSGFADLRVGQYVKIIGKHKPAAGFLAVEVMLEPELGDAEIMCAVGKVDLERRCMGVFDQEIPLLHVHEVKALDHRVVSVAELKPGQMVKLKGAYAERQGFLLKKIRMKEAMEFNIEELRGVIDKLDPASRRCWVNGFPIVATDKTIFVAEQAS